VASVEDEVTGQGSSVTRICLGVTLDEAGEPVILRDWELLQVLNTIGKSDRTNRPIEPNAFSALTDKLLTRAEAEINDLVEMMIRPKLRAEILLIPETAADG
jgi:hypothetical protein